MKKITLLAIDGCLSSSISNLMDAFTVANLWHKSISGTEDDLFSLQIVSPDGKPVGCSSCIFIHAQYGFKDEIETDYLILPAMLPIPEADHFKDSPVIDYIWSRYSAGCSVAAVCTGTFLLAETGLLNKRIATTNWQFEKKFRYRYPEVKLHIGKIITEQDNLICSGAVTAIMQLALKIIKNAGSQALASVCAKAMLVDPNIESQAPYTLYPPPEKHKDLDMLKAEKYMMEKIDSPLSIDHVADHVCISPRHFKRRFKDATGDSPLQYLQKLRIQTAKNHLENSLSTIEEITRLVGYEDSSSFRRLFKRYTSLSPREYRDRFLLMDTD